MSPALAPRTRPSGRRHVRVFGVAAALVVAAPLLAACTSPPAGSASTRAVAWVATDASVTLPGSDVTPLNVVSRKVGATVTVGSLPSAFAYTADDRGLLVVTQGDDTLSEIDPTTHDVVHSVTVGVEPDAVAVAPGGSGGHGIAFVSNLDSNNVTPVDLGTWRAGKPIPVGNEPVAVAVAPAAGATGATATTGATAFVADFGSNQVTPIDVSTLQAGPPIAVGPGPQTLGVSGGVVLVGNFSNSSITPINASTKQPGKSVALPLNPTAMATSPTSAATTYVCGGAGVVPVTVNALGLAIGSPITLPNAAQGIALTADGTVAWVTQQAGWVIPVTLATGKLGKPVRLGGHPSAIVIGAG